MLPCQQCPQGRTSSIGAAASPEQCMIPAGSGVYSTADDKTLNPWAPENATSAMPARQCPQGWWSAGDAVGGVTQNPTCQQCVAPESTMGPGSSSCNGEVVSVCSMLLCIAGVIDLP
jgi:hypothetical protein